MVNDALKRWAEIETEFRKTQTKFDAVKVKEESNTVTLQFLFNRFMEEVAIHNADDTQRNYQRMGEVIISHFGAHTPIHKITRQRVIAYHKSLRDTPYEANRRKAFLHLLWQNAWDWGYSDGNPLFRIKKHRESKFKLKLTADILFDKIYPVAKPMCKRAIMLAFHLVQHGKEVRRLQWANFDLNKKIVSFVRSKTDEAIVINFSRNDAFCAYMDYLRSTKKELSPYLLCHPQPKTGWVPYESLRSLWHDALKDAGFKETQFKFKEIRHLANTCMKDAGITADKRRAMTGHTSVATNEIYTHTTGMDTIDSSRALGGFMPKKF